MHGTHSESRFCWITGFLLFWEKELSYRFQQKQTQFVAPEDSCYVHYFILDVSSLIVIKYQNRRPTFSQLETACGEAASKDMINDITAWKKDKSLSSVVFVRSLSFLMIISFL